MNQFKIISVEDAIKKARFSDYVVVDLRSEKEYRIFHIENAISLPGGTIYDIEQMNGKDMKWILYCNRGSLSFQLASKMARRGYDVSAVRGRIIDNISS